MAARRIAELDQYAEYGTYSGRLPGKLELYSSAGTAQVTQLDSSSFMLQWQAPDGLPLHYLMRVEQGKGPLALLALKNYRLPGQVFLTGKAISDAEEYRDNADE